MLIVQNLSYILPNKEVLLSNIDLSLSQQDKIALIGNNGAGKSTILKIIAGALQPAGGQIKTEVNPYYVPQIFGQYNHLSIAEALHVAQPLNALKQILDGQATQENLDLLNDDWMIEERCFQALEQWNLSNLDIHQKMANLSGGQKTKVFLAGISIHRPKLVLLDEPTNHLDKESRQLLYNWIESTNCALIVVSHDRTLLNLLSKVCELSARGLTVYGGNYEFYNQQKQHALEALNQDVHQKEKALKKAREKEKETQERQQRLDARGKKKQEKAGVARIMMNTLKNNAEKSTSKLKGVHQEKIGGLSQELQDLRSALPEIDKMKFGLGDSLQHKGKILFKATGLNYSYTSQNLWNADLDVVLHSGSRTVINGANGSGKSTLIHLILGKLQPKSGEIFRVPQRTIYIDQEYSLIDHQFTIYQQAQQFNTSGLQEHEVKVRLNRFLFGQEDWTKPCSALSGGEKMRLLLCCLTINSQSPDLIILDEPTNNLDIQNIEILTAALNQYQGTLLIVSHDQYFLNQIHIEQHISL